MMLLTEFEIMGSGVAWGWGAKGHRIIAEIAQRDLDPGVLKTIRRNFNIKKLSSVTNWADWLKRKREKTKPWHYTNIYPGKWLYDKKRDCPDRDCVTEKIYHFADVLRAKGRIGKNKIEALKFLVHFVGDVHQPLHLGNKKDRGGNAISLRFKKKRTNLHSVWDSGLIHTGGLSDRDYAQKLHESIMPGEREECTRSFNAGDFSEEWSNESRWFVANLCYPVDFVGRRELTTDYIVRARRVITERIVKAGVRLAHLLNLLLGEPSQETKHAGK